MIKALTICQPYPFLIMLPSTDERHKRVENRQWPSRYSGPLLIHAGKSKQWIDEEECAEDGIDISQLVFGAIVGIVDQRGSLSQSMARGGTWGEAFPWLADHQHVEGPHCHIYTNVRRFKTPISYRGAQGYFDVPDEIVAEAIKTAEALP